MRQVMMKAEDKDTKANIMEELLKEDLTALNLADILDINESAVRRHLNTLESQGLVTSYFEKASKGRPKKYFELSEEGRKKFPKQSDLLLSLLIKEMKEECYEDRMTKISDDMVEEMKEYFPDVKGDDEFEKKIEDIVNGFDELGFYCSYSRENGSYTIEYRNCAFGNLPKDQASWLCEIHQKLLRELLGDLKIEKKKSRLNGDKICIQKIDEKK